MPGLPERVLLCIAIGREGRDQMARPAEPAACAEPDARSHYQPEYPSEQLAVVNLAHPGDKEAQHSGYARISHALIVNIAIHFVGYRYHGY